MKNGVAYKKNMYGKSFIQLFNQYMNQFLRFNTKSNTNLTGTHILYLPFKIHQESSKLTMHMFHFVVNHL